MSPPESIVGIGGSWKGAAGLESVVGDNDAASQYTGGRPSSSTAAGAGGGSVGVNDDDAASQWDAGSRISRVSGPSSSGPQQQSAAATSGDVSVGGVNDDDAASYYAGSSVGAKGEPGSGAAAAGAAAPAGLGGYHNQSWRKDLNDDGNDGAGGGGLMMRRVNRGPQGGAGSGPSGRNSQSMGGMTAESDGDGGESFVSRAGSYALTDIGVGHSDQGRGSQAGKAGGGSGAGALSPTSTVMRSVHGMSEVGTERDSYGSETAYTNASDSPGAHSGWERAWMRQRNDAR
ncbi:unnamed protein product [Ectocarpus sp. 13 AM-2016]